VLPFETAESDGAVSAGTGAGTGTGTGTGAGKTYPEFCGLLSNSA
jgi:hypothetical protein